MSRHQPGDVVFRHPGKGTEVRYAPTQGSTTKYRVTCPHGTGVNDRTRRDAEWDARYPEDWCPECRAQDVERRLGPAR